MRFNLDYDDDSRKEWIFRAFLQLLFVAASVYLLVLNFPMTPSNWPYVALALLLAVSSIRELREAARNLKRSRQ